MAIGIQLATKYQHLQTTFKMEPIPGDYKELALKHFGETEENRRTKIEEFRQLLLGEGPELLSNIPGQEDSFLLKFLRAGNFEIHTAVQVLKNYIFMIKSGPQYFSPAFQKGLSTVLKGMNAKDFSILPIRDSMKRRMILWKPGSWDPNATSLGDFYSCGYILMELIAMEEESQIGGAAIICDATNFGLKQLRNIAINDIKYLSMFWQVSKTHLLF